MSKPPVTDSPVCVTGASGFVASHIVADLLAAGYRVRGTVRDASARDRYAFLTAMPGAAERLELVTADLLAPGDFAAAVAGCAYVLHTASPYALDVKDPQRDLVDPAVQGTRGVLAACRAAGGVKRVVVTSSMAAVTDEPEPDHTLTEADWNERSSLARNPYYYSKTLAEREAWKFIEDTEPGFDLVTINPFLVIGPSYTPAIDQSNQVLIDLLSGRFPGIIDISWGIVNVRDVALAHRLAFETDGAAGRYICANVTISMRELVGLLRERGFGAYKLPSMSLDNGFGRAMVKLSSYFYGKGTGSYLRTHIGRVPAFDNGKIRRELGLAFRPLADSMVDTLADLVRWQHLPDKRAAE